MLLSISIVNTNNKLILKNCLDSIYKNRPGFDFEVLVADNGSTDGSQKMIKECFPQVILQENNQNYGFARSNNLNFKKSNGKYFLLLNDDTIIPPGAFEKMINFMEKNPDCGISGVRLVFPNGSEQSCQFTFPTLGKEFFHANILLKKIVSKNKKIIQTVRKIYYYFFAGEKSKKKILDYNGAHEVDDVLGACFLIRRDVFNDIGLLDEKYFICREETDFAFRAKKKGWKTYYNPDVKIIHIGSSTMLRTNVRYFCQDKISANYFFKKNYSKIKLLFLKIIFLEGFILNITYEVLKTAIFLSNGKKRKESIQNLDMYSRAIYRIMLDKTETTMKLKQDC
jgi:GT2 family glycosyltransferase